MLQKLNTVSVRGAVLVLLTAVLLLQKPEFGILASKSPSLASIEVSDPSSSELFAESIASLKPTPKPKAQVTLKAEAKIASQTIVKSVVMAPTEVEATIRKYASEYGVNAEIMIAIAKCESGFDASAVSPSGAYKGMYQFVTSTWQSNRRAMGLSDDPKLMFNAEEAIKTAAFKMGRDGYGAWPACSQKFISSL